jgi:hypothetical protein
MSLVISNQQNVNINSTPVFDNWGPQPNYRTYYYSNNLSLILLPESLTFNIKDVIGNPDYNQYSEFRLNGSKQYLNNSLTYSWITPATFRDEAGTYSPLNDGPIPLTENGTKIKYYLSLITANMFMFPVNNFPYQFMIYFSIEGKNAEGNWQIISTYSFIVELFITNLFVVANPNSLNFIHYQGTTLPSHTIDFIGNDWSLVGSPYLILSSTDSSITISTETNLLGQEYNIATGTGNGTVTVALSDFYDDGEISISQLTKNLALKQGSTFIKNIPVNITVYNQNTLNLDPDEVNFYGVKGIQEPTPVHMTANSSEAPFTISKSPWLTAVLETIEIQPGVMGEVLTVAPIPTANMAVGTYTGFVSISDTIDGTPSQKTSTVTYTLEGFMSSPYPSGAKAFTLDPLFFKFNTTNLESYIQLTAGFKTYDFISNVVHNELLNEKLPLFEGKGEINYGLQVHKLMRRFANLNENYLQYKQAEFSLRADEISTADGTVIRSAILPTIYFVAGLSNGIVNSTGFLCFNQKPSRVTPNSIFYLNILVPDNNHEIIAFKNGTLLGAIPLAYTDNTTILLKVSFADYRQGDKIEFLLRAVGDTATDGPKKTFFVLPAGRYSLNVFWEDEFLLQSVLEFTGGILVKSDFENRSQRLFKNLVEVLEIIESTKINKLSINTGWITRNDIDTIESIMRSKRVWIQLPDKTVALRPITKSMTNEDSERELIEYTIEFEINRQYNEETFSI